MTNPHYYSLINRKINTLQCNVKLAKSRENSLKKIQILKDPIYS
ncbi:Uncharacterised protein [Neisseria animalis]|nr:Uncharacterised protein [Neisseria animalis]